jgi:threonine synthase
MTSAPARFPASLRCSACAWGSRIETLVNLCPACGAPVLVHYEIVPAPALRDETARRHRSCVPYAEVLPFPSLSDVVSLGEGSTPLLQARRLGQSSGLTSLWIKDESTNPTRSFKARGMAVAVSMAKALGARSLGAPTAGNAGCALAAYGARAGLPVFVAMPRDTPRSIVDEVRSYGAELQLVEGLITDAGRIVGQRLAETGGFDLSTLKEPYRVEGKKLMGYELLEDLGRLPDVILYPTGGGTGLIGMWKAFGEMQRFGWIGSERPRMYSLQSAGCAPVVRAFEQGLDTAPEWENAQTTAWGLRVPRAVGDRLMLKALRESNGGAVAVPEANIEPAAARIRALEGIDAGPEAGAALLGLEILVARGDVRPDETVVLFNTGGNKYHD